MRRDLILRRFYALILLCLVQTNCNNGSLPAAERTEYDRFILSPVRRVNSEEGAVREPSYYRMPSIVRDKKGIIHVAWTRRADSKLNLQSLKNVGENFSEPKVIFQDSLTMWEDYPTLIHDLQSERIYLSCWRKAIMLSGGQVRRATGVGAKFNYFASSSDSGNTWGGQHPVSHDGGAFNPTMACDEEGHIFVVWRDERNSNADLYINRSLDSGITWLDKEVRISPDPAGKGVANFVTVLPQKDGSVCVIFSYATMDKSCAIFSVTSTDFGTTWGEPVRINDNPDIHMDLPQARRKGQEITVTWHYVSDAVNSIYLDQSKDGGKTWIEDRIIYSNPAGFSLIAMEQDRQDNLHLLWQNYSKEGTSIMNMHSGDFGKTWLKDEKNNGRITLGQKKNMDALRTGVRGNVVAAIWKQVDDKDGDRIMVNFSRDNGKTWLPEAVPVAVAVSGKNRCGMPQILVDTDSLHFLWTMNGKGNECDLYYRSLVFKE